jgi:hypothetical protein
MRVGMPVSLARYPNRIHRIDRKDAIRFVGGSHKRVIKKRGPGVSDANEGSLHPLSIPSP